MTQGDEAWLEQAARQVELDAAAVALLRSIDREKFSEIEVCDILDRARRMIGQSVDAAADDEINDLLPIGELSGLMQNVRSTLGELLENDDKSDPDQGSMIKFMLASRKMWNLLEQAKQADAPTKTKRAAKPKKP